MKSTAFILVLSLVVLGGCTTVQRGAATGAVIGGGIGAVVGHQSGHTAEGAAIGAGAGAVAGAIIGEQMETKFCPHCGRRFTSSFDYCPYDGVALQPIYK
ncbi:MAG: glycine zipper 2TM domain-containing protein [Candidatus Omnitrophota bacterium]|nr:MAG: glycine zipper 2TM domain-containing protein [Candidatus Omnitrophota bacterium]